MRPTILHCRLPLLATLAVCALAAFTPCPTAALGRPLASAAKLVRVDDSAQMRLVTKNGTVLKERGEAGGSLELSPILCTFYDINSEHGTATVTGYVHGSALYGRSAITAYTAGDISHFEGAMTITGGTGAYAHASGQRLMFKGTINRHDFHVSAEIKGTFRQ